jgi:Pyrimidine dimer DNA glycosylase
MQTFLPLSTTNFDAIAEVLDNKRLNKQALEGWQILMVLLELDPNGDHREPKGWVSHPAVTMWAGSETVLWTYVMSMVREWKKRGFNSTIGDKASRTMDKAYQLGMIGNIGNIPRWMQSEAKYERLAKSHRVALLCKNYEWYSQFGWEEDSGSAPRKYEYVWF